MKKVVTVTFILSIICTNEIYCMTEAQVKNAVKLVRNVCQPKFKVTNAQIDAMHKGTFEDEPKQNCYLHCGLSSLRFMKNGKMDFEYAMGQLKSLPDTWKEHLGHALETCKDAAMADDKCQAARQLAKCMYDAEPDFYILP